MAFSLAAAAEPRRSPPIGVNSRFAVNGRPLFAAAARVYGRRTV